MKWSGKHGSGPEWPLGGDLEIKKYLNDAELGDMGVNRG